MAQETGKAIKDAKAEIVRSQDTLSLSAEEAVRIEGEHIPLDASAIGAGKVFFMLRFRSAWWRDHAVDSPVNLACPRSPHGSRPETRSSETGGHDRQRPPRARAGSRRHRHSLPASGPHFALWRCRGPGPRQRSPRVNFITFTGSPRAGAQIKAASGLRRVALNPAATARPSSIPMPICPRPRRSAPAIRCGSPGRACVRADRVCPPQPL